MSSCNETLKNTEWLRRRRLRIEQVRKQSNQVAKQLRERLAWKDVQKIEEEKKLQEREFMKTKVKLLTDLERRYRSSISEIGMGHKLANAEPDTEHITSEKNQINVLKAEKRGKNAALQEIREKKEANEKKMTTVRRKKLTRDIEDIRSNLICSLPKKQAPVLREELQQVFKQIASENDSLSESPCSTSRKLFLPIKGQEFNENIMEKISKKKILKKKKKLTNQGISVKKLPSSSRSKSSGLSRTKQIKSTPREKSETSLRSDTRQSLQESDIRSKSSQSRLKGANEHQSHETLVEFYNFPSRYYCKSYRECDSLVERIDCQSQDALDLARKDEEEQIVEENRQKGNADVIAERGIKALAKEKLRREYSNLMTQLDDLSKKEKKAKSNRRIPPPLFHMTDERLAEIANRKQRNMDSKFETMYQNLVETRKPESKVFEIDHTSDKENVSEKSIPRLNVAARSPNVKPPFLEENENQVRSEVEEAESAHEDSSNELLIYGRKKRVKRKEKKKDLVKNVEKTLEKGRKIRKEATRITEKWLMSNSDLTSDTGLEVSEKNESMPSKSEVKDNRLIFSSPDSSKVIESIKISVKVPEVTTEGKTQRNQNLLIPEKHDVGRVFSNKPSSSKRQSNSSVNKKLLLEDSLPLSASTCYRSPPSELHSGRIGHLIDFLTNLNVNQESGEIDEKFQSDIEKFLNKISKERVEKNSNLLLNTELMYYISKLLGMSREVIANLNVSSISEISTPYITDLESSFDLSIFSKAGDELRGESSQAVNGSDSSFSGEEKIRAFRLKQAEELEARNKEWRSLLDDEAKISKRHLEQPIRKSNSLKDNENNKWMKTEENFKIESKDTDQIRRVKGSDFVRLESPKKENRYEKVTKECSQRISELSEKLQQVRREKEKLLNSSSGNSSFSFKLEKSLKKNENEFELPAENRRIKPDESLEKNEMHNCHFASKKKTPPALEDFTNRYRLSPAKAHHLSTILEADSQLQMQDSRTSISTSDSIPNVMDELFQRNILTSPFHWSGQDTLSSISSARGDSVKKTFKRNSVLAEDLEFITEKEFRPLYSQSKELQDLKFQSFQSVGSPSFIRSEKIRSNRQPDETVDDILLSTLDDSSLHNVNHIISNLGLKWAKPLFQKNLDVKGFSTSSNSDQKTSVESSLKVKNSSGLKRN